MTVTPPRDHAPERSPVDADFARPGPNLVRSVRWEAAMYVSRL